MNENTYNYNIPYWSEDYFGIDSSGNLTVRMPQGARSTDIPLSRIVADIRESGLKLPILIRFNHILRDRMQCLDNAFKQAMQQQDYQSEFLAIYPIKVNQQSTVVKEILNTPDVHVGLESGSKPELLAVIGLAEKDQTMIICNGYKDHEYIRLALIAQKLGHRVFIIIEKITEINCVIEEAEKLNITPRLGLRIRLSSIGAGKWQNTSGEKSKFGLTAQQTLSVVQQLKKEGKLNWVELLHFHMGSQVANIRDIQTCLKEATRFHVEICKLGASIQFLDVGGGLGVDYEGTRSRNDCSINYTIQEYANNIVQAIAEMSHSNNLPQPIIITESGRAVTAHHAVLVTNVISKEKICIDEPLEPSEDAPAELLHLWELYHFSEKSIATETYHDANHYFSGIKSQFIHGLINLTQRAHAEKLYLAICQKLSRESPNINPEIQDELNEKLASKYFCNFSLFQSIPDVWAINQIFPILPLNNLHKTSDERAIIKDITCDSDGRVDLYVDGQGIEKTLPLAAIDDKECLFGFFLVGAYQEILGDIHNLFGDTDSIHVEINTKAEYQLMDALQGDCVSDVLRLVHFNPDTLVESYHQQFSRSNLSDTEKSQLLGELESGLAGYTYFED